MCLSQVMYRYSIYREVNDICIAVNPKHAQFYKDILLFEEFGSERHYPRVGAPAVALRINMDNIRDRGKDAYVKMSFDCNLYDYFHKMTDQSSIIGSVGIPFDGSSKSFKTRSQVKETAMHFLNKEPSILGSLTPDQKYYLWGSQYNAEQPCENPVFVSRPEETFISWEKAVQFGTFWKR